jgi:hypothetical protein
MAARALGAAGCALALSACGGSSGQDPSCPKRFDARAWRAAPARGPARQRLAGVIAKCGYLHGQTKRGVIALIGPPPQPASHRWDYNLGDSPDTGYGPGDAVILEITFGRDGRVRSARR